MKKPILLVLLFLLLALMITLFPSPTARASSYTRTPTTPSVKITRIHNFPHKTHNVTPQVVCDDGLEVFFPGSPIAGDPDGCLPYPEIQENINFPSPVAYAYNNSSSNVLVEFSDGSSQEIDAGVGYGYDPAVGFEAAYWDTGCCTPQIHKKL